MDRPFVDELGTSTGNSRPSLYIGVLRVLLGVMSLLNGSLNFLKCVLFGSVAPVAVTPHKSLNS